MRMRQQCLEPSAQKPQCLLRGSRAIGGKQHTTERARRLLGDEYGTGSIQRDPRGDAAEPCRVRMLDAAMPQRNETVIARRLLHNHVGHRPAHNERLASKPVGLQQLLRVSAHLACVDGQSLHLCLNGGAKCSGDWPGKHRNRKARHIDDMECVHNKGITRWQHTEPFNGPTGIQRAIHGRQNCHPRS